MVLEYKKNYIKNFIKLIDKIILINMGSLFLIYICNFLISIISLPHLLKSYGLQSWGIIVIYQITINYFIWTIDWSFPKYSGRLISIKEGDKKSQDQSFIETRTAQLILLILCLAILLIYTNINKDFNLPYLYSSLILISHFLQPHWYLSSKERIYESAIIQLLNKFLFLILILLNINNSSSINYYFFLMGSSSFFCSLIFTILIYYKYKIPLKLGRFKNSILLLKKSLILFITSILDNINNSLIVIFLNLSTGSINVGIYNIAERIKGICVQVTHPIGHSIFPRMSKNYHYDFKRADKIFKKFIKLFVLLLISIAFIIYLKINYIVSYFNVEFSSEVISTLKILIISFIFNATTEQFINQFFIANKFYTFISRVKLINIVIFLLFGIPIIYNYGYLGAATTNLLCEIIIFSILINKFLRLKNNC